MATAQNNSDAALIVRNLSVFFGTNKAVKNVSLDISARAVTAIIGPSGCGKSTFLRSINRLHEIIPGAKVAGDIWVGQENVYGKGMDPVKVRAHIGMVFQRPNPFPTMSIYDNVASGPRLNSKKV